MEKELIFKSLKFIIASIITNANYLEMTTEEKDMVLNMAFNGLVNSLIPEYAEMAVDIILSYSNTYKEIDNKKLMDSIGW